MNKKKLLSMVLALILVLSVTACGGSGSGTGSDNESSDTSQEVTYLTMGTGGVAGTWYPVGGVLASAMSKSGVASVTVQSSAASIENIRLVGANECQMGMAASGLLVFARDGAEMFKDEKYDNLQALANMMFMRCQFMVRADSGINSVADLAGKNVGTGAPGSGDEVVARGILQTLGIYDKIKPMQLSYDEQVTAFKNRQLDAIFALASAPTAAMLDASSQADVKMLGFTDEERPIIAEKFPFLAETTLTSNEYAFIKDDVNTFGAYTTLFTNTDVPEDVIYAAMKAMFDNLETVQAAHPSMKSFTAENAVKALPIDLHPGALKYYKEVGVIE